MNADKTKQDLVSYRRSSAFIGGQPPFQLLAVLPG
jgi:hypothetical protein